MSEMMDSPTESPSKDTVSTRSNGSVKSDAKMTTDGGMNGGFMQKLRKSFRRVTGKSPLSGDKGPKVTPKSDTAANESVSAASSPPLSPSLSDDSPTDPLKNIEKKEDGETDPSASMLSQSFRRVRKSFRQNLKIYPKKNKDKDTPISEDPEKETVNHNFEEYLGKQCFCEATQLLIGREKHLFGEITEADVLEAQKEEVEKLAADHKALEKRVQQTLQQSLSLNPHDVNNEEMLSALMSAVKAISLEEEQDQLWKQRCRTPPAWRPKKWKECHDSVLHELVNARMDNPLTLPDDQVNQSSIQADINSRGRQLKEDLLLVVMVLKTCYPPEMDICNFYAKLYHQNFSSRLQTLVLELNCTFLLQWVNDFYPGILQEPELASNINTETLGKLLPDDLLKPLEEQYLSNQQRELMIFIDRALESAKEEWDQGKRPTKHDGCYVSPVACDVIQFINGVVTSAQKIVGDQQKAQKIIPHLTDFMQRYKDFFEDIIKQNRKHSKALVKANLGCVRQFRDFLTMESHLFPEDVRENCLQVLTEMKQSAHTYLLNPVHKVLKPHYQKLGTSDWLKKNVFEKLLFTIDEELQELQGSTQSCHQELIGQLHQEVTEEYVQKLLRGEVKLKDSNQQQKAYMTVNENAERLHELFTRMGSKQEWLKEILTKIAEVLKLQDIPAIQMQIVLLGSAYPDLSDKHISALLRLKTNLSKADKKTIKTTVLDILSESHADAETQKFFSNVEVK